MSSQPPILKRGILFTAYYFPPMNTIGVWRNYFLAKFAKNYFKEVFISTSDLVPSNEDLLKEFNINQNKCLDYRSLLKRDNANKSSFKEQYKANFISRFFIKLINSFPFNLIAGEGGLVYIRRSVKSASTQIKLNDIQYVYSSYRPMSDHFIAYCLKKRHKKLVWIADFRDLPFDPLYKQYFCLKFQKYIMFKLLSKADIITTFSEGIKLGLNNFTQKEIHILPNGPFESNKIESNVQKATKFTLQYSGSLFLDERDPSPLMKILSELKHENKINSSNIVLKYCGKDGTQWNSYVRKNSLSDISNNLGLVSYDMSRQLQQQASINIILTSSHPQYKGILTGKFFEYIAAGKPIICIVKGVRDEQLEHIFLKYQLGILLYHDAQNLTALKNFIVEEWQYFQEFHETKHKIDMRILDDFNWDKSLEILVKILDNG